MIKVKRSFEFFRYSFLEQKLEEREEKESNRRFKICPRCGKRKPTCQFSVDKRSRDKHASVCKICKIEEYLKYYDEHKSEILARDKKYRETHEGYRSKYHKDYQEKHKKELKEKAQNWYKKNKERIKVRNLKYYREHEQACRARRKLWIEKNKEKIKKYNREYKRKLPD